MNIARAVGNWRGKDERSSEVLNFVFLFCWLSKLFNFKFDQPQSHLAVGRRMLVLLATANGTKFWVLNTFQGFIILEELARYAEIIELNDITRLSFESGKGDITKGSTFVFDAETFSEHQYTRRLLTEMLQHLLCNGNFKWFLFVMCETKAFSTSLRCRTSYRYLVCLLGECKQILMLQKVSLMD